MAMATKLPLHGVRVVDLTVVWAGPSATRFLGDWGAEVIRPEPLDVFLPNTRGMRARPLQAAIRPGTGYMNAPPDWEIGRRPWNRMPIFTSTARNKLSMTVNMSSDEGREILLRLVAKSDILVENYALETLQKLRLEYDDLKAVNPAIVMVRMPAYGLSGPYSAYRSYGQQLECALGHTMLRGQPEVDPSLRGDIWPADAAAGVGAAFAAVLALRHRRRTGQGQLVEFSQAEFFLPFLGQAFMDYSLNGEVQETIGNRHPDASPHGCYPCSGSDRWIALAVQTDSQFLTLCRAMGEEHLGTDPRFLDTAARLKNQDELDSLVSDWTRTRDLFALFHLLQSEGIPCGPLLDERDAIADPQMVARGFFQPLTHAEFGMHLYPGPMWKQQNSPNALRLPPVRLGEHNEYVYRKILGVSVEEYDRLVSEGHIGMDYPENIS
jgi:crotonobetainyl-CoA:carnitine CoA-transferase CaiB-like acyl-CoA transferase